MPISEDRSGDHFCVVADTRRRWSAAEKAAIVAEASGRRSNISAVARRHGINPFQIGVDGDLTAQKSLMPGRASSSARKP